MKQVVLYLIQHCSKIGVTLFCLLFFSQTYFPGYAESLFFTYGGTTFSYGKNRISYTDWFNNRRETHDVSGAYYMPGLVLDLFVDNFIGELSIDYLINQNDDSDTSIQHMSWKTKSKYVYSLNNSFALTLGVGLFLETPPSTKKYDGGGGILSTGAIYTVNWNWKIFLDIQYQYGYMSLGDNSTKASYGAVVGIIRKLGKL
jgi:hypothetical protein